MLSTLVGPVEFCTWCIHQMILSSCGKETCDSVRKTLKSMTISDQRDRIEQKRWSVLIADHPYPLFVSASALSKPKRRRRLPAIPTNRTIGADVGTQTTASPEAEQRVCLPFARMDRCLAQTPHRAPTVRFSRIDLRVLPSDMDIRMALDVSIWANASQIPRVSTTTTIGMQQQQVQVRTLHTGAPVLWEENSQILTWGMQITDLYAIAMVEDDGRTLLCAPLVQALEEFKTGKRLHDPRRGAIAFRKNKELFVPALLWHPLLQSLPNECTRFNGLNVLEWLVALKKQLNHAIRNLILQFCKETLKVTALSPMIFEYSQEREDVNTMRELAGPVYRLRIDAQEALRACNERVPFDISVLGPSPVASSS